MQGWTIRAATLAALSAGALFGAVVSSHAGVSPTGGGAENGFAGPVRAHVHIRPLDSDLEAGTSGLHQVRCASSRATTSCFAAF